MLTFQRASLIVWTIATFLLLVLISNLSAITTTDLVISWCIWFFIAAFLNIKWIRRHLITRFIVDYYKKSMPQISITEREALNAGTVGWEGELFSGMPDWKKLSQLPKPALTIEEEAFIANEVEQLCEMIDDWDITHHRLDLPPAMWTFLKMKGFFGMIIPKKYGGKEFSALAHAAVLIKLGGRSATVASTVAVPNSLGPAELLLHYGTEDQKNYYLPRLANGTEIPCFALTGPESGSDASAMQDNGVVCYDNFEGKKTLGIKLNWDKRYITLAPIINSALVFTLAAIMQNEKPAVASAILKYHTTELGRRIVIDAMDIHGGKGICLGPKNYLGRGYQSIPISITVEGANLLTRNMMIFGQGMLRCHPYVLAEMNAAMQKKPKLKTFDNVLFAHMGFTLSNFVRAFFFGLTQGRLASAPQSVGKRYYQQLTRFSAAFAVLTDSAMLVLQGKLKRKENLSARLGDVLSLLYLGSAVLTQFEFDNQPEEDEVFLHVACQTILYTLQQQIDLILKNFPNQFLSFILRYTIFPFGKTLSLPRDSLNLAIAEVLLKPNPARDRLTQGIFASVVESNFIGKMNEVLLKIIEIEPIEKKLRHEIKKGHIKESTYQEQIAEAVTLEILTQEEEKILLEVEALRKSIIAVDDFSENDLK